MPHTFPGPAALGRGVVVGPGAPSPAGFGDADRVVVDSTVLDDPSTVIGVLHRAWAGRRRIVVELCVPSDELRRPQAVTSPPYRLSADHEIARDRLHFLVWANTYDLRSDEPIWWLGRKAVRLGAEVGGPADVILPDNAGAWIDGGPRQPLDGDYRIVHRETIELGRLTGARPGRRAPSTSLAPDQLAAVTHAGGAARVIAPAGSGKTRTLTARLLHLLDDRGLEPELVTAVAYNAKAAAELVERLAGRRAHVRTIHSLGYWILRQRHGHLEVLDERAVRSILSPLIPRQPRQNRDIAAPYLEALTEVRIGLRDPEAVEDARDDVPGFAALFDHYRSRLASRQAVDYDEQVYGAIEALLADPDLRRSCQMRARHLLVDEFQDLTPAYLLLLRLVAAPGYQVFGVGDDDQVIYGYSGADPAFLLDFEQLFPSAGSYALEVNYRCPAAVVDAAGTLLAHNERRITKTIEPGPDATPGGLEVERAPADALGVAAGQIVAKWWEHGTAPSEVAVLARVNHVLLPVQAVLHSLGIPFTSTMDRSFLHRTSVRAALAYLRIGADQDRMSRQDLIDVIKRPSRQITTIGREILGARRWWSMDDLERALADLDGREAERFAGFLDDLRLVTKTVGEGSAARAIGVIRSDVGLDRAAGLLDGSRSGPDRSAHTDDLAALQGAAALHDDPATLAQWLGELLDVPDDPAGVTLSSVHRVKGMEWRRVIVYGADLGLFPHRLAADLEEERRIFHVAMTRGAEEVVVLADERSPSPFLAEMRGEAPPRAASGRTVTAGRGVERGRPPSRAPVDEDPADPELLETLKAWRLERAREQNVPAYVVLNDRHLRGVAVRRPRTDEELLACPGIGPVKLELYGEELLALLESAP